MMRQVLPNRYEKDGLAKLNNAIKILESVLPKTNSLMGQYDTIASRVTFGFIRNTRSIKSLSQENQRIIKQAAIIYMLPYSDTTTIISMLTKLKYSLRQLKKCAKRRQTLADSILNCGI